MKYKIKWTEKAYQSYRDNIFYLQMKWTQKVVENFVEKTEESISYLKEGIYFGVYDEDLDCDKILIVEQMYLYYEIKGDEIVLLLFKNNYQEPLKDLFI